jgi:hypothetical protein
MPREKGERMKEKEKDLRTVHDEHRTQETIWGALHLGDCEVKDACLRVLRGDGAAVENEIGCWLGLEHCWTMRGTVQTKPKPKTECQCEDDDEGGDGTVTVRSSHGEYLILLIAGRAVLIP